MADERKLNEQPSINKDYYYYYYYDGCRPITTDNIGTVFKASRKSLPRHL